MARDLASRSSKGQLRIAKKSGHDIMLDEPQIVVQAIRDVWATSQSPLVDFGRGWIAIKNRFFVARSA
jgi:hypothetical protein